MPGPHLAEALAQSTMGKGCQTSSRRPERSVLSRGMGQSRNLLNDFHQYRHASDDVRNLQTRIA